mmetsp:Transcript_25955/g.22245  ORF Transcript_25955/g.22245 Transcript_25955/m.22245 type:complete len:89 (+) Transcript_25955:30-296(+)
MLTSYVVELKTSIGWIRVAADSDCLTGRNACTIHNNVGILLRPIIPEDAIYPTREIFKVSTSVMVDAAEGKSSFLRPTDSRMSDDIEG